MSSDILRWMEDQGEKKQQADSALPDPNDEESTTVPTMFARNTSASEPEQELILSTT